MFLRQYDSIWDIYQETRSFLKLLLDNYPDKANPEYEDLIYALNEFLDYGFEDIVENDEA